MSENKVKSVLIVCRNHKNDERDIYYRVGQDEVTEIIEGSYSPEPYCGKSVFTIMCGSKTIAKVTEPDEVKYK